MFDDPPASETLWHGEAGVAERALRELLERGESATAELHQVLREHPRTELRQQAAVGLARLVMAQTAPPDMIVPALVQSLRADPATWSRHRLGRLWDRRVPNRPGLELVQLGPRAAVAAAVLGEALGDATPHVRYWAAATLAEMGPAAAPASQALIHALADADWEIRHDAVIALGRIGPDTAAALPSLLARLLADEQPEVRVATALALWRIARRREGIPVLVETLRLQPPPRDVLQALIEIGRAASVALPVLETARWTPPRVADTDDDDWLAVDDPSLEVELEDTRHALSRHDESWLHEMRGPLLDAERIWWAQAELPTLIRALHSPDEATSQQAAELLRQLAPAGGPDLLRDLVDVAVRPAALRPHQRDAALACLARYAEEASPGAGTILDAAHPLVLVQPPPDEDRAHLRGARRPLRRGHPDVSVRLAAVRTLARLVPGAGREPPSDWARRGDHAYLYAVLSIARQDGDQAIRQTAVAALVAAGWLTLDDGEDEEN